jgi:tyrosine-specific transport protein
VRRQLILVTIIGSIIPLLVYVIWEYVTLGTLSVPGEYGLHALANRSANSTEVAVALEHVIGNPHITLAARIFSVTAIITSLLGVSLSLFHFLADGLQVAKHGKPGILLFLISFIPPIMLVIFAPSSFTKILGFGGIFVAILLGMLPVSMAYMSRYRCNIISKSNFIVPGGKPILAITFLFFLYAVYIEIFNYI